MLTPDRIQQIEARLAAATPDVQIDRYEHGGGRCYVMHDDGRELVADYYKEGDRELHYHAPADLRALLDDNKRLKKEPLQIMVSIDNEIPAFGAYLAGSTTDGVGQIVINLAACAGVEHGNEELFRDVVCSTLGHEIIHALQEKFGLLFREDVARAAMDDPIDLECAEDDEQMIQQMTRDSIAMSEKMEQVEIENKRLRGLVQDALELAQDAIDYEPDYFREKHKHDESLSEIRKKLEASK